MTPSELPDKTIDVALNAARRLFEAGYVDEAIALLAETVAAGWRSPSLLRLMGRSELGFERLFPRIVPILRSRQLHPYFAEIARAGITVEAKPSLHSSFDWSAVTTRGIDVSALGRTGLELLRSGHVEGLGLLEPRFAGPALPVPSGPLLEAVNALPARTALAASRPIMSDFQQVARAFRGALDYQTAVRVGVTSPALAVREEAGPLWRDFASLTAGESQSDITNKIAETLLEKGYGAQATRWQLAALRPQPQDWPKLWRSVDSALRLSSSSSPSEPEATVSRSVVRPTFGEESGGGGDCGGGDDAEPPGDDGSDGGDGGGNGHGDGDESNGGGSTPPKREVIVTGHDQAGAQVNAFAPKTEYGLRFRVGAPVAGNLASGDTSVDVPSAGLKTRWIVTSTSVTFLKVSKGVLNQGKYTSMAEFDLDIPGQGESDSITLDIETRDQKGELELAIFVAGETYRRVSVLLESGAEIDKDVEWVEPAHTNLSTTHEWTTPPERIEISVFGDLARIITKIGQKDRPAATWYGNATQLKNPINRVRGALEKLRETWDTHLNDVDQADMEARLKGNDWFLKSGPLTGWTELPNKADTAHEAAFGQLSGGDELYNLAQEGYRLFDACFPEKCELRQVLKDLTRGSHVDFTWPQRGALDWASHVPWALMYIEPPKKGKVNCENFLGLRLRIGSYSYEPSTSSRALGEPLTANLLHFLYWGDDPNDEIAIQSEWQRKEFAQWDRQHFIPVKPKPGDPQADPKAQVVSALEDPKPAPAVVLYFYCECSVKDGGDPVLQFGDIGVKNTVRLADIYQGRIESAPLVFANACTTLGGDPQGTNELEETFFRRNIRAFLGTETKVPVVFASRFAWLFFQFFLGKADPDHHAMAVGEALSQARLFLWTQYRNPGGLFYCLVNQYDLFLASTEDVGKLQRDTAKGT